MYSHACARVFVSACKKKIWIAKQKMLIFCLQLTAPPVNTKALSLLTSAAGDALTRHLGKILPALMSSLSQKIGMPDEEQVRGTV